MLGRSLALCTCRAGTLSVGLRALAHPFLGSIPFLRSGPPATWSPLSHHQRNFNSMSVTAAKKAGAGDDTARPAGAEAGFREKKMALRKSIKAELKAMSEAAVDAASTAVAERLLATPQLAARSGGGGGGVSVYLSMPGELGTAAVVSELFKRGKKIYIPKVSVELEVEFESLIMWLQGSVCLQE